MQYGADGDSHIVSAHMQAHAPTYKAGDIYEIQDRQWERDGERRSDKPPPEVLERQDTQPNGNEGCHETGDPCSTMCIETRQYGQGWQLDQDWKIPHR